MGAQEDTERIPRIERTAPVFRGAVGRAVLAAMLGLLVTASVAVAAPPWSVPELVSSPSLFVDSPRVVFDSGGRAYATWRWTNGTGPAATGGWRYAVRDPGAAEFGPERTAPNLVTPLVPSGADRVLALDERRRARGRVSLRARFAGPDGQFGRPDTISTHKPAGRPPSVASHGDALAAWIEQTPRGRRIVRAAVRRPGHRFGRPVTLRGRGRASNVVAGAGLGLTFVAWERAGLVEARVWVHANRRWGPLRRVGGAEKSSTTFRVAFGGRRAYLAWLAERAEFGALSVAVLPAGSTRFRAPQFVDNIDGPAPAEQHAPAIVTIPERDALLAWTDRDPTGLRVRAAVTGQGGRFGTPFDVSPPGEQAVLGAAASIPVGTPLPAGTAMAVWSRLDAVGELGDSVRAAIRPPGGSFGAPEDVSDLDRARLSDVAFDFVGRRWTAVWSQRIGLDVGVPLTQITTFLRSSTRPG
jgi:hypothetical protein